jgi:hypothetical protein
MSARQAIALLLVVGSNCGVCALGAAESVVRKHVNENAAKTFREPQGIYNHCARIGQSWLQRVANGADDELVAGLFKYKWLTPSGPYDQLVCVN